MPTELLQISPLRAIVPDRLSERFTIHREICSEMNEPPKPNMAQKSSRDW